MGTDIDKTTIPCDQKLHNCTIGEDELPVCTSSLAGGEGVNCTVTDDLDEYYCLNDATTGAAECVYPPKHDCYDTSCTGKDTFNTTNIPCDQELNRCGFNETGYPLCINSTRGNGVDCSTDDVYSCSADNSGSAICVALPTFSCYDNKCVRGNEPIDCDQSSNKCEYDDLGVATCVNNTRGHGIDCSGDYTCGNDPDTGAALCVQDQEVSKFDCYDSVCTDIFNTTVIPCDQSEYKCGTNSTGAPTCDPSTVGGSGVNCTGPHSNLTSPLDFHCNITSPSAQCVFTPPHSCHIQFCKGTGDKESSWFGCDGTRNVCHVTEDGSPVCEPGPRGAGVDCRSDTSFYCSLADKDPFTAACRYPESYSCYNTKCRGILTNSNSYVDCPQNAGYCSVDKTGVPVCNLHPELTGDGVHCTGEFSCVADPVTGVASCKENSGTSSAVWVVVSLALVVAGVLLVVWWFKRRSRVYGDRELLLSPESF